MVLIDQNICHLLNENWVVAVKEIKNNVAKLNMGSQKNLKCEMEKRVEKYRFR